MSKRIAPSGFSYSPTPVVASEAERDLLLNAWGAGFDAGADDRLALPAPRPGQFSDAYFLQMAKDILKGNQISWDVPYHLRRFAIAYIIAGLRDGVKREGREISLFGSYPRSPVNIRFGGIPYEEIVVDPSVVRAPPRTRKKAKAPPPVKETKMAKPSLAQRSICERAFTEKIFPVEGFFNDAGKRRYRRTSSPKTLKIPLRKDFKSERESGRRDDGDFGILINPRNGQPLVASQNDLFRVRIRDFGDGGGALAGRGYFETDRKETAMKDSYSFSSMATGYPRVHTPGGVEVQGGGYGTVLYSALCLASHLDWAGVRSFRLEREGIYDGISSMPGHRSPEAEAWWNSAKVDFNLAYEISAANPFLDEDDQTYHPCDVYEYRMLAASNMVVAWRDLPRRIDLDYLDVTESSGGWGYDTRGDGKRTAPANRKAVVNMNVSGLTRSQFTFFLMLARESKATNKELAGMQHRFDTKTDISWKFGTKRPTASGYLDGGLTWQASGQTQEGLSRAAEMPEEYERLAQERADLGWPFMAD
jgi:hypothetical protein